MLFTVKVEWQEREGNLASATLGRIDLDVIQSAADIAAFFGSVKQQERNVTDSTALAVLELFTKESCAHTLKLGADSQSAASERIAHILRLVTEGYADPSLSLKVLSTKIGLSERHLGRKFREATGKKFREYLRFLRLQEAMRLLLHSSDSVKIISGKVGYIDQSHFCEDFRTLMKCTPSKYRSVKPNSKSSRFATGA